MPRLSNAGAAAALNGLDGTGTTNVIGFTSLHTADPLTTGANENPSTGGYAAQATAWNAANTSTGTKTNSSSITWTTAGTTPVPYFGCKVAASGAFSIGGAFGSSVQAATITAAPAALSIGGA